MGRDARSGVRFVRFVFQTEAHFRTHKIIEENGDVLYALAFATVLPGMAVLLSQFVVLPARRRRLFFKAMLYHNLVMSRSASSPAVATSARWTRTWSPARRARPSKRRLD